ncbi:MAG: DMT family transporter [Candidatus Pacearchaeota archaeon]|jgi:transporter family protein
MIGVIETSILFAFGAMLFWAFGDFFIQKCTRKIGNVESLAFIGLIGSILLLPFIISQFSSIFNFQNFLILSVLGVITFVGAILNFEALKQGKLSIIDVIIELELPVVIILAFIFFKETLSLKQALLISLIFTGIVLVSTKSFSHWKTRFEKGIILAFLAAIGMGIIDFLTSFSSRQISPIMAIWFPWIIFTLFCFIFILKGKGFKRFLKDGWKHKWIVLAMGIFDTLAWFLYAFATLKNEVAIVTAITESYPALAICLGVWFNKEKINWHQWLGAVLALLASIALAFLI